MQLKLSSVLILAEPSGSITAGNSLFELKNSVLILIHPSAIKGRLVFDFSSEVEDDLNLNPSNFLSFEISVRLSEICFSVRFGSIFLRKLANFAGLYLRELELMLSIRSDTNIAK